MVKVAILFILMIAPMYAQETSDEGTPATPVDTNQQIVLDAPIPDKLASSPFIIRVGNETRTFPQTVNDLFLKREFMVRHVGDGADRTPTYLPGILSNDIYILPIEIRSLGRRYTVAKFFFRVPQEGDPYLFRWEELNFINRSILRYESFSDVLRSIGYIENIVVQPPRKAPQPPAEAAATLDTQSTTNEIE